MADISKIQLPSGTTYNIKDATAREAISNLTSFSYILCTSPDNTPTAAYYIDFDHGGMQTAGLLAASDDTANKIYLVRVKALNTGANVCDEWLTIKVGDNYRWERIGSTEASISNLGDLAYANTATGNFTPAGTIGTGSGTANYTPAGSVAAPTITVTPTSSTKYLAESATGGGSTTPGTAASCTLPVLTTTVSSETLTIGWTEGSFTANTPTAVTLPSFTSGTVVSGITSATASAPAFTGTAVELTFTGTQDTVTVAPDD